MSRGVAECSRAQQDAAGRMGAWRGVAGQSAALWGAAGRRAPWRGARACMSACVPPADAGPGGVVQRSGACRSVAGRGGVAVRSVASAHRCVRSGAPTRGLTYRARSKNTRAARASGRRRTPRGTALIVPRHSPLRLTSFKVRCTTIPFETPFIQDSLGTRMLNASPKTSEAGGVEGEAHRRGRW